MNKSTVIAILILIILSPLSFAEDGQKGSVPLGTGIGQIPEVKEVTRLGNTQVVAEYMPLEKGSVWTYEIQKNNKSSTHTQKIVSESGGWSVFDNYFGKQAASLRIAPDGELLVTSGGVVSSFYNENVIYQFPDEPVETPEGKFEDAMVVTIAEGDDFWFRDVYLKGVGLVYHERKTPKTHTSYNLLSAKVGGSDYPKKKR